MALNFPIPTSVGQVYQDPTSGNTYVCTSLGPPAQWVGSGSSTSLDSTYLRTDASNDPVTGNLLLNPTTNVSPLTLQQPVGNSTPALKIENSGSGNSIEANGFAVSQIGIASFPSGTVGSPSITTSEDTNTGIYFPAADTIGLVEGGVEVVRINSSGNVGIGTVSPATRLHVDGTIRYTNRPAAGTITPIGFDSNGDLRASSSSLRYKHDIQDLKTGLEEVMQLRPVQFKFNGETRTNMGFIAEEVDELGLEDVLLYDEENQPEGVLYANMVSLLTKAIQEQQVQIEELKTEINLLKGV